MINKLKEVLIANNYSIIAIKDSQRYTSKLDGIKPVIFKLNEELSFFNGSIVVDKVIGKASASLLALSGAREVYGLVMSISAKEVFEKYHIIYHYDELVPYIINRRNDGMCPMEETVKDIEGLEDCYKALNEKLKQMASNR